MFIGNYEFARLNLGKIGRALTKQRSLGFNKKKVGTPIAGGAKPIGPVQKASSSKMQSQNAARAKFEKMGKLGAKPPSAAAQAGFGKLGTKSPAVLGGSGVNQRQRKRRIGGR